MRLAARALAVVPSAPEPHALDRDLAVQQLVVRAPDHAEAARAEALEQAVAIEHELLGACGARAPARLRGAIRRRGGSARGLAGAGCCLDEGAGRLHRLPRSPRARPVPAADEQENAH